MKYNLKNENSPCKVVFMCGSHPRHLYIADVLNRNGRLAALVVEKREEFVPEPDNHLDDHYKKLFIRHFENRQISEDKYFGMVNSNLIRETVPVMDITQDELNTEKTEKFLSNYSNCILLSYGIHKLNNSILNIFGDKAFNIHGGLSPWFRGNATLFWPFYFLKPQYAGMTIHRLTSKLDGGDILHHSLPDLVYGDGIHDTACRAVVKVADDLCKIFEFYDNGKILNCVKQKNAGKLFVSSDWDPVMLGVIYDFFNDKIVDMYLDGKFYNEKPNVVNFFDSL
jgi:hypothetical protein